MSPKFYLRLLGAALFMTLTSALPAAAQTPWFVYLYSVETAELVRLNSDGSTQSYSVGLAPETFISARQMAFTPDGSRVAFCAVTYTQDPAGNPTRLIVRDLVAQTNLVDADLGLSIGCQTGPQGFNDDFTRIAVGRINYLPGQPGADESRPLWQVQVLDAATGALLASLDEPADVNISQGELAGLLPLVRAFTGTTIVFNPVLYATDMNPNLFTYRWDSASGQIAQDTTAAFAASDGDRLSATGERVWIAENPDLPSGEPLGPMPRYNVVLYSDAANPTPRLIYHNPQEVIIDAALIEDGARLGVVLMPGMDPSTLTITTRWAALDRAGVVADLGGGQAAYADIFGLPGGYGVLELIIREGGEALNRFSYTAGGVSTELWSAPGGWELAFVPPAASAAPNLTPFAEVISP